MMPQDKSHGPAFATAVGALFDEYRQPNVPGASVMVIQDGRVLYKAAFGLANLEEGAPSTTHTNYRLASVTKQFTAMAIMLLAERRQLAYDDRLPQFFPAFPPHGQQITIRHLLNHTSGLMDYEEIIPHNTTTPLTDRDVLELLQQQTQTYFSPGSAFRYSNSGYALLALIVERISGLSFAAFLKKHIFEPLQMSLTVAYEQGVSIVPNRAYGYTRRDHGFERTDASLTSSVLGDGGIYSSVEDLYKWDQALYTTQLVGAEMLDQAFTPGARLPDQDAGYGFGWFIGAHRGEPMVWHHGETIGFRTMIARFPRQRLTVIVLVNKSEGNPSEIALKIADLFQTFSARGIR
jgi:CubicO group peptidase (beta-lactamase class C family)